MKKTLLTLVLILLCVPAMSFAANVDKAFLKTLPAAEQAMADEVDHWGLPFSDQLRRFIKAKDDFRALLEPNAPTNFILGIQHGLEKVPLNKYWFKGRYTNRVTLSAARNEYENLQIAVLPDIGTTLQHVSLSAGPLRSTSGTGVITPEHIRIYRVGYVTTVPARYPTLYTGSWPDILLDNGPVSVSGTDLGLFWVELKVPTHAAPGDYAGTLTLTADKESVDITVALHVYDFALPDRVPFPIAVWTTPTLPWGEAMSPDDYRRMAGEFLRHGIDPLGIGQHFVSPRDPNFQTLDANLTFAFDHGLQIFNTPRWAGKPEAMGHYVQHLREKGWADRAMIYIGPDEPDEATLAKSNIPRYEKFHTAFPDIRVFLAGEYHPNIDKACDLWLTDVSTAKGAAFAAANHGRAALWFYFCHLPIHIDYCRPLVQAPNLQIDNEAIEARLTLWLCWKYGTSGMFIWSGNREWKKPDVDRSNWEQTGWPLSSEPYGFPYAGIHNGNGYLIYPGPHPSIRMKLLRDGQEDLGYLMALKTLQAKSTHPSFKQQAQALLDVPTEVLVGPHYFNRDPAALLSIRDRIARLIESNEP